MTVCRAQMTFDQRAKVLHYARAEFCTHGPALSLDPDILITQLQCIVHPILIR